MSRCHQHEIGAILKTFASSGPIAQSLKFVLRQIAFWWLINSGNPERYKKGNSLRLLGFAIKEVMTKEEILSSEPVMLESLLKSRLPYVLLLCLNWAAICDLGWAARSRTTQTSNSLFMFMYGLFQTDHSVKDNVLTVCLYPSLPVKEVILPQTLQTVKEGLDWRRERIEQAEQETTQNLVDFADQRKLCASCIGEDKPCTEAQAQTITYLNSTMLEIISREPRFGN